MSETQGLTLPKLTTRTRRKVKRPNPSRLLALCWLVVLAAQIVREVVYLYEGKVLLGLVLAAISVACFCYWHRAYRRPISRPVYRFEWWLVSFCAASAVGSWFA